MKHLKIVLALLLVLPLLQPNTSQAAANVNGPLTFTEVIAQNTLTWGSPINIMGSGFNHVTKIYIVAQESASVEIFNPIIITHEDSQITILIPDYVPAGKYDFQLNTDDNVGRSILINNAIYYFNVRAPTIVVANSTNYNGTHPIGSFVNVNGTIYRISGAGKLGFASWNVFLSHGGSSAKLVPGNSFDASLSTGVPLPFADGTLVRYQGKIYYMWHGARRAFASDQVFSALGYSFANVIDDDLHSYKDGAMITSGTSAHLDGTLVNSNGTIYRIFGGSRYGIPNEPTFYSHGFSFAKTVPINSADSAYGIYPETIKIANGSIVRDYNKTIWLIEDGKKIGFSNYAIYQYLGYGPNNFVTANVDNYYPEQAL